MFEINQEVIFIQNLGSTVPIITRATVSEIGANSIIIKLDSGDLQVGKSRWKTQVFPITPRTLALEAAALAERDAIDAARCRYLEVLAALAQSQE